MTCIAYINGAMVADGGKAKAFISKSPDKSKGTGCCIPFRPKIGN